MDNVLELTYLFMTVLLLALLVERMMEVLTGVWDLLEWKLRIYRFWNGKAEKLKRKFENKAKSQILLKVIDLTPLTRQIQYATRSDKAGHSGKLTIISGEMIRQSSVAFVSRIMATIMGIILSVWANINFVAVFEKAMELKEGTLTSVPDELQLMISGVVIGLGSEPVHSLISSMEKNREDRRKNRTRDLKLAQALKVAKTR